MALRDKRILRQCRIIAPLVTLITWAFHAQATKANAQHQWQALNAEVMVMTTFQTGNYVDRVPMAEKESQSGDEGECPASMAGIER
jgi:hypothetical protein